MSQRRILVTAALPYANGHIHLGHLVEYIQTDIWVRFQKLRGHRAIYICADDTHGTAIMIRAKQEGRSEEDLIGAMREAHIKDFTGFDIQFDNYGSTNSPQNKQLCGEIWETIRKAGLVAERDVEQLFDPQAGTFLADRFVKGTCPNCKAEDQYGDSCERCGTTYTAADLIDPVSIFSGAKPEMRSAKHLFIQIEKLHGFLEEWISTDNHVQPEVANYLKGHFLCDPLRDWDISRPAPYFGFEIPDSPGHYWFVWFDAPIGYLASTLEWCQKHGEHFDDWWRNPQCEVHHFIGKDIQYFHVLFWPVMLKTAGMNLPKQVHIHGFLTVNGMKISKRAGTFVTGRTYLDHLDPSYLRYYYATKLGPRIEDIDLNLEEFINKVNADLVGKVVNLASRSAKFVRDTGLSAEYPEDGGLFKQAAAEAEAIAEAYETGDYNRAMRQIMALVDRANQYVEHQAPWTLKKDPQQASRLQDVCTVALNLFRQAVVYLSPVLPKLAEQTGQLLNQPIVHWEELQQPLVGTPVNEFQRMLSRVEPQQVQAMIEASRSGTPAPEEPTPEAPAVVDPFTTEPLAEVIGIDEFMKVDLRVARVEAAEAVPEANKLVRLTLHLGGDHRRNVFAGIKAAYDPAQLVGRLVICVANLAPRKMKFGVSEGMVVAAGPGGKEVFLLSPDSGAQPGQRIH